MDFCSSLYSKKENLTAQKYMVERIKTNEHITSNGILGLGRSFFYNSRSLWKDFIAWNTEINPLKI